MADALVEPSSRVGPCRFFCHHCNVEFEDTLQEYICPYCSGGFIEELAVADTPAANDSMDTDTSTSADDDMDFPIVNDLAFLMSGGRLRGMLGGAETLLQQIVFALAGGTEARAVGAGAPFVFVGAPGDYVLGGEGLDAVVTQLLGQLEGAGPPPLPRDQIDELESVAVTLEQVNARLQCSVCWDHFTLDERVSQLSCSHVYHRPCIAPWLQLHATCPICRRCLLPDSDNTAPAADPPAHLDESTDGLWLSPSMVAAARRRPLPHSSLSTTSTTSGSSNTSGSSTSTRPMDTSGTSAQYDMDLDLE